MNSLKLELSQKLNMTQQLVQAVTMLAMSGQEINDLVDKELLENPVLELAESIQIGQLDERWTQHYAQSSATVEPSHTLAEQKDNLQDHLIQQAGLNLKTAQEKAVAEYIIGSLNESGYLEQSVDRIAKKFNINKDEAEKIRTVIQELDPPGFASLSVAEFLLLQLGKCKPSESVELAKIIITEHLLSLAQRDFASIALATGQEEKALAKAAELIRHLNPRPVSGWSDQSSVQYIIPDIMIEKIKDKYAVSLNPLYTRRIRIQDEYSGLRKQADSQTKKYLNKNLRSAQWVIQCLEQREKTIRKISGILVELQRDFLDFGLIYMKPLTLRQVAQIAQVHESTVSRTVSGKYALTPHGTLPLKDFFPSGLISLGGQKVNCAQIKKRIVEIIRTHEKISDRKIAEMLFQEGITIARRTVAKYRSTIGVESSFTRKG